MSLSRSRSSVARLVRAISALVINDLKAFYFEARMVQKPEASYQDLHRWFWSETALAGLLIALRDRLKAAGDPRLDQLAFGIAR